MTPLQSKVALALHQLTPQFDVMLAPLTYFKIGGPAEVFFDLKSSADLVTVVRWCLQQNVTFTVLGGASNVIIDSAGLRGVVIRTSNEEYQLLPASNSQKQRVKVGAGYRTGLFVRRTIEDGLTGLEYFLGVPGKVGGAVYNNAHYLSDLIGQHVAAVEVITATGDVTWVQHKDCNFAYDQSRFQQSHEVIVQIEFLLPCGNREKSLELVKEATLYRAKTQPLGEPSSGCYFRNTPNTPTLKTRFPQFAQRAECPTAFLIDQAGLKGTTVGGVTVSQKHAAFLINTGSGTSNDVRQLAEIVKQRVREQYGVELQEEVFFLK